MFSSSMYDVLPKIMLMLKSDIYNLWMVNKELHFKIREYAATTDCKYKYASLIYSGRITEYMRKIYGSDILETGTRDQIHDYVQNRPKLLEWLLKNDMLPTTGNTYHISPELLVQYLPIKHEYDNVICTVTREILIKYPVLSGSPFTKTSLASVIVNDPEILRILPFSHILAIVCREYNTHNIGIMVYYGYGLYAIDMGHPYNPMYLDVMTFKIGKMWHNSFNQLTIHDMCAITIALVISDQYDPLSTPGEYGAWIHALRLLRTRAKKPDLKFRTLTAIVIYTTFGGFSEREVYEIQVLYPCVMWNIRRDVDDITLNYIKNNINRAILCA